MNEPVDPETRKYLLEVEKWKAEYGNFLDWNIESFKALIQFALAAIRGVVLINGGAAIAVLAFLGNVWSKDESIRAAARTMQLPLSFFLSGVAMGVTSAAAAYMAQVFFTHRKNKAGLPFQVLGILLVLGGLIVFVIGSLKAADFLTQTFV
ncbi:MAG TPA: hypothetical protein VNF99_01695 [Stellaceae bacterium]|nr:hypothetical protein [Stellaceae bacterium]